MGRFHDYLTVDIENNEDQDIFQKYIDQDTDEGWIFDGDELTWSQMTDHDYIEEPLREILEKANKMNIDISGQIIDVGDESVVIYRVKNSELIILEV